MKEIEIACTIAVLYRTIAQEVYPCYTKHLVLPNIDQ